jgi:hypothetical protein
MKRSAACCANRRRSAPAWVARAVSTSLRSATDAPPGWALSHSQCRGSSVTSRATTPSFGRPGPRAGSSGDAYITRKSYWWDEEGPEISFAEWRAVVDTDAEMELDRLTETRRDDGRIEPEGVWVWTAYSDHDKGSNYAWFLYRHGQVVVRNPEAEIICKMWFIAQALSAKGQGDDGEVYDSFARASHPDARKKPWWRFW